MDEKVPPSFNSGSIIEQLVARHLNSPGELGELARQFRSSAARGPDALAVAHHQAWTSPTFQRAYREEARRGIRQASISNDANAAIEEGVAVPTPEDTSKGDGSPSGSSHERPAHQPALADAINRFNAGLRQAATPNSTARQTPENSRGRNVHDEESTLEPDWEMWRLMGSVEVWRAAALMLRLNPDSLIPRIGGEYEGANKEFYRLLRVIHSNTGEIAFESLSLSSSDEHRVKLSVICRWAAEKGFRVPPELLVPRESSGGKPSAVEGGQAGESYVTEKELRYALEAEGFKIGGEVRFRRLLRKAGLTKEGDNPENRPRTFPKLRSLEHLRAYLRTA